MTVTREKLYEEIRAAFEEREEGGRSNHFPGLWSPYAHTVVFIGTVGIGGAEFIASG